MDTGENLVIVGSIPGLGAIENPNPTEAAACANEGRGARMTYISDVTPLPEKRERKNQKKRPVLKRRKSYPDL